VQQSGLLSNSIAFTLNDAAISTVVLQARRQPRSRPPPLQ
jgi:hypothetical protein